MAESADPRVPEYERLAKDPDGLVHLAWRLAPKLVGLDAMKKALIACLLSMDDYAGNRGRVHIILHGPPGSGKSSLVEAAAREAQTEVFSSRMSPGSVTVDFRNGRVGALGQMHDTKYQVFVVDEIEKVTPETLRTFLRAMEEGAFTVPGEGAPRVIPAHWRLIAAANDISQLPSEFLDRFDFKIYVPALKKDAARRVVASIAHGFMKAPEPGSTDEEGFVRGFMDWARSFTPSFPDEERRHAERIFNMVVDSLPVGEVRIRPFESILRVAFAIARLERSNVRAEHVLDAVSLVHSERNWNERFVPMRDLLKLLRQAGLRTRRRQQPKPEAESSKTVTSPRAG